MSPNGEPVWCGLDIGTTHIKCVLVGGDGSVLGLAKTDTPVSTDGVGPCHDPEEIRLAAESVICRAQAAARVPTVVQAIGVTSVGEEGVPIGRGGEVLYPAIAWFERRPSPLADDWLRRHPPEELFAVTGLHPDLGLTVFKLLWLKSSRPTVWKQTAVWLGIGDYVTWKWTGRRGMSYGHASRTALFDLIGGSWREDWVSEVLPRGSESLPRLVVGGGIVGTLRADAIPGLVAARDIPVVATGLDHIVGAYAAAVTEAGRVLDSMGTAEALLAPVSTEQFRSTSFDRGIDFGLGTAPDQLIAIAALQSGAGVSGIRRILGGRDERVLAELDREAGVLPAGAEGLLYVPPRIRGTAGGAFFGHRLEHRAAHFLRAAMEGWSLAADDALAALVGAGAEADVVCIGGGSGVTFWMQLKASIFGRAIRRIRTPEIVAVGAALLARSATGEAPLKLVDVGAAQVEVTPPVDSWLSAYRSLQPIFREHAAQVHGRQGDYVYP
ncbi:MAG: hypothetical protein K6T28_09840 [Acidothermus sp.]|nr:hypothetical protein [Acidothermus sp.]